MRMALKRGGIWRSNKLYCEKGKKKSNKINTCRIRFVLGKLAKGQQRSHQQGESNTQMAMWMTK